MSGLVYHKRSYTTPYLRPRLNPLYVGSRLPQAGGMGQKHGKRLNPLYVGSRLPRGGGAEMNRYEAS